MARNDAAERIIQAAETQSKEPLPTDGRSKKIDVNFGFGVWSPETAGEKGYKVLLYGASGSGKTYMAGTFPDPVFLDIEGGMRTLLTSGRKILRYPEDPRQDVTDLSQVRDFYRRVKALKPEEAPFKTIVVDSLNELQVLILKNLLGKYQATRQYDDQPTMADYGKLARDMQTFVRLFIQLPYHIVFTAISTQREYPDDMVYPMFIGKKTGPDIQRMMDIIGYCHVRQQKGQPVEHVVGFEESPTYEAKDRTGSLGSVLPNTYQAMEEQVRNFYSKKGSAE